MKYRVASPATVLRMLGSLSFVASEFSAKKTVWETALTPANLTAMGTFSCSQRTFYDNVLRDQLKVIEKPVKFHHG